MIPHPLASDPPVDDRPRTTSWDLPAEVAAWLQHEFGSPTGLTPIDQLVNSNHCFAITSRQGKFFVKVSRHPDAAIRLRRQEFVLRHLEGSGLPAPKFVAGKAFRSNLAVLVTTWIDASPMRHVDFSGRISHMYLREFGSLLAAFHSRLRDVPLPAEFSGVEVAGTQFAADDPEDAAAWCIGADAARRCVSLHKQASDWIAQFPRQTIHGDMQDKNILLSRSGDLFLCDFENVCTGPAVFDLSVDRIYLKRDLPEPERSSLQQLLLEGYGVRDLLETENAALLRCITLFAVMQWRFVIRNKSGPLRPDEPFRARFSAIEQQLSGRKPLDRATEAMCCSHSS